MSTVHHRYQVLCPVCHLVGAYQRQQDARAVSAAHSDKCEPGGEIFDLMAKPGQPELWRVVDGKWQIVGRRKKC